VVDELACDVLHAYERGQGDHETVQKMLCERYADEAIQDTLREIETLQANGYLVNNDSLPAGIQVKPADADQLESSGMTLMVAHTCNLRCAYCYTHAGSFSAYPSLMNSDTARQAIDFLVKRSGGGKTCKVGFFGGEPMLNLKLIREVVAYSDTLKKRYDLDFTFNLTTNGTLLRDGVLEFLCAHEFGIVFSLDGPRQVHDACRCFPGGRGSFDCVMEAARKIKSLGRPLWVRATLTHQSPPLEQLLQFFEHEVGADRVLVGPMMDVGDVGPLSLTEGDLDSFLAQEGRVAVCNLPHLINKRAVPYNPLIEPIRRLHRRRGEIFSCDAGKGQIAVASNGDIYPCHRFVGLEAFVIGNVWHGLDGERWANFFNNFDEASQKCKSCWAYYQCAGGCARQRALDDGTFSPPGDTLCRHWRSSFELAIATYAGLRKDHPDVVDWIAKSTAIQV